MFWIHGGGWEFGTPLYFDGCEPISSQAYASLLRLHSLLYVCGSSNLTSLYNVIIVTAAYRLGPLGFLAEEYDCYSLIHRFTRTTFDVATVDTCSPQSHTSAPLERWISS